MKHTVSAFQQHTFHRWEVALQVIGLLLLVIGGLSGCLNIQPSEEDLTDTAERFINALNVQIGSAQHNVNIVPWYNDTTPSSYIVSTYELTNGSDSVKQKLEVNLPTDKGWVVKEAGDVWFMETLSVPTIFCARIQSNGKYYHTPSDNSVAVTPDRKLIVTLYYWSPSRCKLQS